MSNRILISLLLLLSTGMAAGESGDIGTTNSNATVRLGSGNWLLYRPQPRAARIQDFDLLMTRLRCGRGGVGLRYSNSPHFTLDLMLAPFKDRYDYVGPVHDMDIGATRLSVSFSF